jgi:hypothetical protein
MLTSGVVFFHESAHPHTAARPRAQLQHFYWELFDHPDVAPNHYHLFTYLRNWLRSQRFENNELMEGDKTWLNSHAADYFGTGVRKLIPRYYKFPNSGGDYVEEYVKCVRIFLYI